MIRLFLIAVIALFPGRGVSQLRCEYLDNPIGIDAYQPRFTWIIQDNRRNVQQEFYRLIVAQDPQLKGIIWDSGEVSSSDMRAVYDGPDLAPRTRYWWSVEIRGNRGKYHRPKSVFFETGKCSEPWCGRWISDGKDTTFRPVPYFRKDFSLKAKPVSARLYIATRGLTEVSINGKAVSDRCLSPAFTRYDRRCLYTTDDVTSLLQTGDNALGVVLAGGWYNFQSRGVWEFEQAIWRDRPSFCLELHMTFSDGSEQVVTSGPNWTFGEGEIRSASIYTGEQADLRMRRQGWNTPGFDDSAWEEAVEVLPPKCPVVAESMPPIRVLEIFEPSGLNQIDDTTWVYSFPENMAGVTRLHVQAEEGTRVRLKHGEALTDDGHVDQSTIDIYSNSLGGSDPFQTDIYILSGGDNIVWPHFGYKGFQYVEVTTDRPVKLSPGNLTALRMASDVTPLAEIQSSDNRLVRLWRATNRSYQSNLMGYPTDCPQREKNGWTADAHVPIDAALYNYDGIAVYEKWMRDHRDCQLPDGTLPAIVPTSTWGYTWGNGVDWTSSLIIIPWHIWVHYGDKRILEDNYEAMSRLMGHFEENATGFMTNDGLGDWAPYMSVADPQLVISLYWWQDARLMEKIAMMTGHEADAPGYRALADSIAFTLNKTYLSDGIYSSGCQTEQSAPLFFGIVPIGQKQIVADRLAERVLADGGHLDVGLHGSKTLLYALSDNGYIDLAYRLITSREYPSWGWWEEKEGATTLYETWNIDTETISRNHIMFGAVSAWMTETLGGMTRTDSRTIHLHPVIPEELRDFSVLVNTAQGRIVSSWRRTEGRIWWKIEIPAGQTALVQPPAGYSCRQLPEETLLGSGKYRFFLSKKHVNLPK
ncbi:MAG: family 78 glycoside hydrolase catalytic domain [Bacteroidales bacterium]|nr:family 78 glycoside hydrolase catalytic domain [Bacteroidales bacterium]